jgi:hypothetical protein
VALWRSGTGRGKRPRPHGSRIGLLWMCPSPWSRKCIISSTLAWQPHTHAWWAWLQLLDAVGGSRGVLGVPRPGAASPSSLLISLYLPLLQKIPQWMPWISSVKVRVLLAALMLSSHIVAWRTGHMAHSCHSVGACSTVGLM